MSFCSYCGASLAADARFCARCGKPVASAPPIEETIVETGGQTPRPTPVVVPPPAPPATPPPAVPPPRATSARPVPPPHPARAGAATPAGRPQQSGGKWWIVPLVIVGLVVIAWLVLGGLPFGGEDDARQGIEVAETETIADQTAAVNPPQTATIIEVPGDGIPTTETAMPPLTTTAMSPIGVPPVTTTQPGAPTNPATPPPTTTTATPAPRPAPSSPAPAPAPASARVTEGEAESRLRSYITSRNVYPNVARSCLQIRRDGYRNEGYGFSVWQACVSGGGAKRVGMWRVDAKDGSLYRRNDAGRYVSP